MVSWALVLVKDTQWMSSVHNIIFFSSFITELKNTIETQINEVKQQIEGELDHISG